MPFLISRYIQTIGYIDRQTSNRYRLVIWMCVREVAHLHIHKFVSAVCVRQREQKAREDVDNDDDDADDDHHHDDDDEKSNNFISTYFLTLAVAGSLIAVTVNILNSKRKTELNMLYNTGKVPFISFVFFLLLIFFFIFIPFDRRYLFEFIHTLHAHSISFFHTYIASTHRYMCCSKMHASTHAHTHKQVGSVSQMIVFPDDNKLLVDGIVDKINSLHGRKQWMIPGSQSVHAGMS